MLFITLAALIGIGLVIGKPFYSVVPGVILLFLLGAPLLGARVRQRHHTEVPKKCLACGGSSLRSGWFSGHARWFFPDGYQPPAKLFVLYRGFRIRGAVCLDCGQLVSSLGPESLRKLRGNEPASAVGETTPSATAGGMSGGSRGPVT